MSNHACQTKVDKLTQNKNICSFLLFLRLVYTTHLRKGAMMTTLGEKPETAGSDDVSGSGGGGKGDDEACRYVLYSKTYIL